MDRMRSEADMTERGHLSAYRCYIYCQRLPDQSLEFTPHTAAETLPKPDWVLLCATAYACGIPGAVWTVAMHGDASGKGAQLGLEEWVAELRLSQKTGDRCARDGRWNGMQSLEKCEGQYQVK